MLRVQVVSGPDVGKGGIFLQGPVRVGRAGSCDVTLSDTRVSTHHLEILLTSEGATIRDNRSLHGTTVRADGRVVELKSSDQARSIDVTRSAVVLLGATTLQVEVDLPRTPRRRTPTLTGSDSGATHVMKTPEDGEDAVTRRLQADDPRMAAIFGLARRLNALADFDEVLALVAETAFTMFPRANFFAVIVPDQRAARDPILRALRVITRDPGASATSSQTLSNSLLGEAFTNQEAVLYLGDVGPRDPSASMVAANISAAMVAPLMGQKGCLGVLELDSRGVGGRFEANDLELFTVLASSTAFAMERLRLTENIYEMFEGIVRLSVTAIDARDPATAGHSERVADYSLRLAVAINDCSRAPFAQVELSRQELVELRYAALLHDFGKIGVSERVLTKANRLSDEQLTTVQARWEAARHAARSEALERAIQSGLRGGDLRRALDDAHATADQRCLELDEAERILVAFQPGRRLTPEARTLFEQLTRDVFRDSRGVDIPLLSAAELEQMCIASGTLTPEDWDEMRSHSLKSETYLATIPWGPDLARIPEFAGGHHEKLDGSGYPRGIRGDQIPLQTRIMTVVDIFDAMTAIDRPYRKATPVARAIDVLRAEAQLGMLDETLVELFIERVIPEIVEDYRLTFVPST